MASVLGNGTQYSLHDEGRCSNIHDRRLATAGENGGSRKDCGKQSIERPDKPNPARLLPHMADFVAKVV